MRIKILACGDAAAHKTLHFLKQSLGMTLVQDIVTSSNLFNGNPWSSGVVRLGDTEIEVVESVRINTSRRYAKKPDMLRLLGVNINNESHLKQKPEQDQYHLSSTDIMRLCIGNSARILPYLNLSEEKNPENDTDDTTSTNDSNQSTKENNNLTLKEMVLGTLDDTELCKTMNEQLNNRSDISPISPSLWQIGIGIGAEQTSRLPALRILPSIVSSLILYCPSFDQILKEQSTLKYKKIGYRGGTLKKGQLMLDLPVPGLDLRLDEDIENQSSFNEGREVLFKDVIKGLGDVAHSSQPGCGSVTRKELVGILTRDKL